MILIILNFFSKIKFKNLEKIAKLFKKNLSKLKNLPELLKFKNMKKEYDFLKIEKKWQEIWEKTQLYKSLDEEKNKKNFYCLDMFPYPSGEGLHVGHLHGYIASDIIARYMRMKGFNVLHPMGFDAFGLPAENAAIKRKIHPKIWTFNNIQKIRKQLKSVGFSFDWDREIITCEPGYYKFTQWMFLQFFHQGLAIRKKAPVNFCPSCKTVLANEQVIDGKCERCGSEVLQKEFEQWFFKITRYAKELLKGLEKLDWPEKTKLMQRNWIGESEGWEIKFQILDSKLSIWVFTTRADTLFGCTYLVLAPEHPLIEKLKPQILNFSQVKRYIERAKRKTERERISELREKTGVELKGVKALNPVNKKEISIFVADYVLFHYATGAIMAVPCHDQRDFEFAKKYNLPMIEVIKPEKEQPEFPQKASLVISNGRYQRAYEGKGILINSGRFTGMRSERAKEAIGKWLERRGVAKRNIYYKLKDWLISRQRYWGCPIPLVFCENCKRRIENKEVKKGEFSKGELLNPGWIGVEENSLPVLLPEIKDYLPTGEGKSPLARSKEFVNTICPKCGKSARRETDTMDTFVCSSWYFFRYVDPKNKKEFASPEKIKKWLPVNLYIGGAEHATMHLLYARFFTKVLRDLKKIDFDEPFLKLRHQGTILGPDGQKMSKSKGNVIPIDETIEKYGADTMRLYEMFMGPFEAATSWQTKGINGCFRFLQRVWNLIQEVKDSKDFIEDVGIERLIHRTIKKVSEDIENFKFNTAISSLMVLVNQLVANREKLTLNDLKTLLLLLAPFAPHLTEELWQILRPSFSIKEFKKEESIHLQRFPEHNPKLIKEETLVLVIQVNGRVRDKIEVRKTVSKEEIFTLTLGRERVKKWIEGKRIKKIIFVPNKLINIVV